MFKHYFIFLIIFVTFLKHVRSDLYTVGDDEGWTSDANFRSWSDKYNFSLGDVLVFKYVKGQHNVYEVTEATYRSCDASTGVLATYDTGNDQVELTEAKTYWFICNVGGHCLGGMRFGVEVKGVASNTQREPTSPTSSCTSLALEIWSFWIIYLFNLL